MGTAIWIFSLETPVVDLPHYKHVDFLKSTRSLTLTVPLKTCPKHFHAPSAETTIPGAQDRATNHLTRSAVIDKSENRRLKIQQQNEIAVSECVASRWRQEMIFSTRGGPETCRWPIWRKHFDRRTRWIFTPATVLKSHSSQHAIWEPVYWSTLI